MKPYNAGTHLGLFLTRATLGLYLTLAGWGKVVTEVKEGFGTFYDTKFSGMSPGWLPGWLGVPYGYALPWLELIVGGLLVLGLVTRFAAAGGFLMLVSFTIALVIANDTFRGQGAGPGPFTANYIQAAAYFLLIFTGAGALSVDKLLFGKTKKKAE